MINIGIIGPGRVGARHADAIHQSKQVCLWVSVRTNTPTNRK